MFNCKPLPLCEILTIGLIGGLIVSQNIETVKSLVSKIAGLFFRKITIRESNNPLLFPKFQTFLKKRAIGGNREVVENGNGQILAGTMLTMWPFALIHVSCCPELKASVWLHRFCAGPGQLLFSAEQFVKVLDKLDNSDNLIRFYTLTTPHLSWQQAKTVECVTIPLLCEKQTVDSLDGSVQNFLTGRDRYRQLGKTHKFTVLAYGPTGSGKTSLIKWLAMKYRRNVYIVDPSVYFNDEVETRLTLPIFQDCQGGILLFEDIDRYFATLYSKQDRPNISKFLNFLDGLCTPDDIIIALTANYESDIPDVIRRDGRIDLNIHLPYVSPEVIEQACRLYQVDAKLVEVDGMVSTSNLVKQIENHLSSLKEGY